MGDNSMTLIDRRRFVKGTVQYALCWNDKWVHERPGDRPKLQAGGKAQLKHTVAALSAMVWQASDRDDRRRLCESLSQILLCLSHNVFTSGGSLAACDTLVSMMGDLGFSIQNWSALEFERQLIESLESKRAPAYISRLIKRAYNL